MTKATPPKDDSQLDEFATMLAMLPAEERYAVAVEFLDIAENHSGDIGSLHAD